METMMKADAARDIDTATQSSGPGSLARMPWNAPSLRRLRAGLAETGPNAGYDGVEGTS
ncbi:MAG TPA: hypothetical protein VFR28_03275 [Allosphingosinicella sp.]|jgi:hypothetical protein|nr:hypothetical protein [Allosphingosinicella sp.]